MTNRRNGEFNIQLKCIHARRNVKVSVLTPCQGLLRAKTTKALARQVAECLTSPR